MDIGWKGGGAMENHVSNKRENGPASTGSLTLLQEKQEERDTRGTRVDGTWKWGAAGMCRDHGMRGAGRDHPGLEPESGHRVGHGRSPPERG